MTNNNSVALATGLCTALGQQPELLAGINVQLTAILKDCADSEDTLEVWARDIQFFKALLLATAEASADLLRTNAEGFVNL